MKTSAIWIALAAIACLEAKTSLALADQIAGRLALSLSTIQLDAAAQAVLNPARMVRLAASDRNRTVPQNTFRTGLVMID